MKTQTLKNRTKQIAASLCAIAVVSVALVQDASAVSLSFGDARDLGYIQFGIPSGDTYRTAYVNYLLDMSLGTVAVSDAGTGTNQTFTRSNVALGSYPDAVFGVNGDASGSYNPGNGTYLYMFAKYDGPNYGAEVWYIGGLNGTIKIPTSAGSPTRYGLSGVTFFEGVTQPGPANSAPDGGTTVALLGIAMTGLGLVRRKLA